MAQSLDEFSLELLEQAKRFLEKADKSVGLERSAYLRSSLLFAFAFLESQINSIAEEMAYGPGLSALDRSVIEEKELKLENGLHVLKGQKFQRVTDRIEFLIRRFSGDSVDKTTRWWGAMKVGSNLRNDLTHPRTSVDLSKADVENALLGCISAVNELYLAIYKAPFPQFKIGLSTHLEF